VKPSSPAFLLAMVIVMVMLPLAHAQQPAPDIIFFHGNILTGTGLAPPAPGEAADPTPARVTALAVRNGSIVAAGTDASILALKGPHTATVDLKGSFAMPGFNDAHTHIAFAGQKRLSVDLDNVPSLAAMLAKIRAYAASLPAGEWVVGGGWDHTKWSASDAVSSAPAAGSAPAGNPAAAESPATASPAAASGAQRLPTRQDLDAVTGDHPALLERTDGHIAVANSAALRAANITAETPDPPGGKIDRDAAGNPTGIIRERPALALIQQHIPPPSYDFRRKSLLLSINDALSHGVTSIQDFSDWDDWLVLEGLEREGNLPLRIAEWIDFNLPVGVLKQRRASHWSGDPLLHLTMLKAFMDGSLGSRTAAMNDDYSDDPGNAGIPRYDPARLNGMSAERAAAGFQLGFHAIGDRANDMALDALQAAEQAGTPANAAAAPKDPDAGIVTSAPETVTPRDFRFRIEHAQVVSAGAFDRFAQLGIIASMQPSHLLTDMAWAPARLGPERSRRAYAWKSFLDHGVTLAFGTDYPVESINPFRGLYAAVTRMNEAGTQTFEPQEKITLNQAIYAYTQASAFAEFRERIKGRLEPGFLADFVVLDRDITQATPQALLHTQVLRTVVGGKTVYTQP
jgi:predicted amidohydrolase YtcJ